ncbi:TetR/AcrR family transcriptional regulator [Streptomyces sp. BBFR102]|uniref:TetR/AcrR family transcriptional regulator n=1 Tax=Streptomyces sp. BBFR102 TaxID=3448171 RepID=UPI003F538A7A
MSEKAAPATTPDASRRSDRSRRAIYESALALVSETGYAKLTIEAIAARAGVGKQTIYRWWPSKGDVVLEAFLDLAHRSAVHPEAGPDAPAFPDTGDLAADLKLVLRATVDELNDPAYADPARALCAEGILNPQLGARFLEQALAPGLQLYGARLATARERGEIGADAEVAIATDLLVAPLTYRWLMGTGPLDHGYADALVDHVLGGLRGA